MMTEMLQNLFPTVRINDDSTRKINFGAEGFLQQIY
jgi:hypothetical protein